MNKPINKRAIAVGIFIVVGLVFLVGGVMTIGNLHSTFSKKISVSTVFVDVNGLASGNNIWFSGVKIGTVKKLEFYGKAQVKVIMNINTESKQYIRKDAKVKISTDGLIGNKILVIYGGTPLFAEVEEGDTLSNEVMLSAETIMSTFQESNLNILALTKKLTKGEGTIGKLMTSDSVYNSIASTANSLQVASANAQKLIASLSDFSSKLNTKGTLTNDLVTDTTIFNSFKSTVLQLHKVADTASVFVSNLKRASEDPNSPVGVLLHDQKAGADLKATITNLNTSSKKLDQDLEALQHSFLLRKHFRKASKKKKAS